VPIPDSRAAKSFGSRTIDDEIVFRRLLDQDLGRLGSAKNLVD
jgi:hypothetical protein